MHASKLYSGPPVYFNYQKVIETYNGNISGNFSKKYLYEKFCSAKWLYSKNLVGHTGCVNALAFSKNGGEFLVSGGDDRRVLVWKLCEAVTGNTTPTCLKEQHQSNIFCVTFDHDNRHVITAGNDEIILYHDFESGEVVRSFDAEANTNEVCIHPEDNNIFIAAESSFGAVTQFDLRTPAEQTILAVPWPVKTTLSYWPNMPNFSSAKFNPVDPELIATANLKNGVQLWDSRFPKRCLRHFDSTVKAGREIAMSVAFDHTGRYIAVVRKTNPPVLYHIDRDTSLVEFSQKGYGNTVTRKSVCFAGQKDEFIMTGSEDFNVYLWKVPKLYKDYVGIAKVEQSSLALEGHRSIVNQACFNRDTAMICSSGVEKIIKMWSPFRMAGGILEYKSFQKRRLYTHDEYSAMLDANWPYDDESTSEDEQMLAMVDQWLLKPQQNISDDSEFDHESPIDHAGVFVNEIIRDNLYMRENLYDSEISQSPESTDTGNTQSPDGNSENDWSLDVISENRRSDDVAFENTRSSGPISRSLDEQLSSTSSDRNLANCENTDSNLELSDGVGLARLREIITSQEHPRDSLGRIAELRRSCLRDDDG